jgi:hypothetical protein
MHENGSPLNAELNPICHLLALMGAHHTFHVTGRVKQSATDLICCFALTTKALHFFGISSTIYQLTL